jgi:hypothetical protein
MTINEFKLNVILDILNNYYNVENDDTNYKSGILDSIFSIVSVQCEDNSSIDEEMFNTLDKEKNND